jgi:hypothetical protein
MRVCSELDIRAASIAQYKALPSKRPICMIVSLKVLLGTAHNGGHSSLNGSTSGLLIKPLLLRPAAASSSVTTCFILMVLEGRRKGQEMIEMLLRVGHFDWSPVDRASMTTESETSPYPR